MIMNPHTNADARRDRLRAKLAQDGADAYLISGVANVTYLTGFKGEASHLVVSKNKDILVSDARFTEQIKNECPGLEALIRPPTKKTLDMVAEAIRSIKALSIGFECQVLTVSDFESLKELLPECSWLATRERVETQRMVKEPIEIEALCEAIKMAQDAFTSLSKSLSPSQTEKNVADELERLMRSMGAQCAAFPIIVAAGSNAALPHAIPSQHCIGNENLLLIDWGASSPSGYKSDLTRVLDTHSFSKTKGQTETKDKLRKIYSIVLGAQKAAFNTIKPGVKALEVDHAARQFIADAGFGDYFGHGLGHGIGLQIHEAPWFRPGSETILEPGMVFTLEPGIYLPGWGGVRIEDNILVTSSGAQYLTGISRELDDNIIV
ncbi:aminopeptidase P family protein [bacterium]|nr:aminopeptidase P family protein [bacterium]NBT62606.1 aminopeptidase P family protein [Planctomycetia bacterium]